MQDHTDTIDRFLPNYAQLGYSLQAAGRISDRAAELCVERPDIDWVLHFNAAAREEDERVRTALATKAGAALALDRATRVLNAWVNCVAARAIASNAIEGVRAGSAPYQACVESLQASIRAGVLHCRCVPELARVMAGALS